MEFLGFIQGQGEFKQALEFLLTHLIRRRLNPKEVLMVTSDGCPGMMAARRTLLPYSEHQRCLFYKMGNLRSKCPKQERPLIKARLDRIYIALNRLEAKTQAENFIREYRLVFPALVTCLEKDLDNSLAYMGHPPNRWKHIRTTILIEYNVSVVFGQNRDKKGVS